MEIKYNEISSSESSLSYYMLNNNDIQVGTIEGYAIKEVLIVAIHIDTEYQKRV